MTTRQEQDSKFLGARRHDMHVTLGMVEHLPRVASDTAREVRESQLHTKQELDRIIRESHADSTENPNGMLGPDTKRLARNKYHAVREIDDKTTTADVIRAVTEAGVKAADRVIKNPFSSKEEK